MISPRKFLELLHILLLKPLHLHSQGFVPSYSTKKEDFSEYIVLDHDPFRIDFNGYVVWWHEEPLNIDDLNDLKNLNLTTKHKEFRNDYRLFRDVGVISEIHADVNFHVFANSEISELKRQWLKSFANGNPGTLYHSYHDWYFFYHGFLCLDWYRDFYKIPEPIGAKIDKVFICFNHLIEDKRNYRLHLLSLLHEKNILKYGHVSCPNLTKELVLQELLKSTSPLTADAKKHIYNNLHSVAKPLYLDETNFRTASAEIPDIVYSALWHVVTETIFYDNKLHLTEKIFKPIVTKRPFILVGAVNNLQYLKSYGFKTFDQWIDESYDSESDPDKRLQMIAAQLNKLCNLSPAELEKMHQEMQEVLDYNHIHFFTQFKEIIVNELVDNFEKCTRIYNTGKSERYRLPVKNISFSEVKKILLQ